MENTHIPSGTEPEPLHLNGHARGFSPRNSTILDLPGPILKMAPNPGPRPSKDARPEPAIADLPLRLQAQPHAHQLPQPTKARERDLIPRQRDEDNQPLPNRIVFQWPAMFSDRKIRDTAFAKPLDAIAEKNPGQAGMLEALWDESLLGLRQCHIDARTEALDKMNLENEETQRRNLALEGRRAEIEAECDKATQTDREALPALDEPLVGANAGAGKAMSLAGHEFDPAHPSTGTLLSHEPLDLHTLAGRHQLPFHEEDKDWGNRLALWTDIVSGALFGTSFALVCNIVQTSQLSAPGVWLPKALCVVMMVPGAAIALKVGETFAGWMRESRAIFWLGRPGDEVRRMNLMIALKALPVVALWIAVDGFGLMKMAALTGQNSGKQSAPLVVTLALGAAVAIPFMWFALARGWRHGCFIGCLKRLLHEQEAEFAARDAGIRARPQTQEALARVADVLDLHRRMEWLKARIAQTGQPFHEKCAALDAQKREMRTDLNEAEQKLIQDADNDRIGGCGAWRDEFQNLLDQIEPIQPAQVRVGARTQSERTNREPKRPGLLARLAQKVNGWMRRGR